ncbi:MAG: hypothetical protein SGJ13_04590 [Actinomycetota bacterium]|nr:hypothetical protein [Actinomycetota bacterium]
MNKHRADGDVPVQTLEPRFWFHASVAVLRRPHLWWTALRQIFAVARPGWWRHRPFVPRPDPGYLRFRFETAYGHEGVATARDFVAYLEWLHR